MTDYKATPEQWENMKDCAADNFDDGYTACILELCFRVEALEAAGRARLIETLRLINAVADQVPDRNKFLADTMADEDDAKPTPNSSQIGSSDITPPPDLVQQWASEKCYDKFDCLYELHIATRAAQWGADQELEACCEEMKSLPSPLGIPFGEMASNALRSARRPEPQPPSLKEQAIQALELLIPFIESADKREEADTIRQALEALPND